MKGLNTDINPRRLPEGVHSEFTQMTYESGVLKPRNADESFTAPSTGFEGFIYTNLTSKSVQQVDFGEDYGTLLAHVPLAGGTAELRNSGGTYEEDLTLDNTLTAPTLTLNSSVTTASPPSSDYWLQDGDSMTFSMSWRTANTLAPTVFQPSDTFTISVSNWKYMTIGSITGTAPSYDDTVTGGTSGATGNLRLFVDGTSIVIEQASGATAFQNGETLSWTGGSVTSTSAPSAVTGIEPTLNINYSSTPTDAYLLVVYALDTDGTWREIVTYGATPFVSVSISASLATREMEYFPYTFADQTQLLTAYPGPVDDLGLVETLSHISGLTCSLMTEHRGCLFVVQDRYIYPSEPLQYRYFVKDRRLDAGATIQAIVSRDDYLEVYTDAGLKLLVGDYPNHYFRETGITASVPSHKAVVASPGATFAYVWDTKEPGVYSFGGGQWRDLTRGVNQTWLRSITQANGANVVLGVSASTLYVFDPTTQAGSVFRALCYDFTLDEWFERYFSLAVNAARFDPTDKVLVVKLSDSSYKQLATDDATAVSWAVAFKEEGGGLYDETPETMLLDVDGSITITLTADDNTAYTDQVAADMEKRMLLPSLIAKKWTFRFSGSGSATDTEIREVVPNG